MSWFKKSKSTSTTLTSVPANSEETGESSLRRREDHFNVNEAHEQALDAIASVVRTLGRYSFDVPSTDKESFGKACETWARHILTGAPLEDDHSNIDDDTLMKKSSPPLRSRRPWKELLHFLMQHRREEQQFVEKRIGELKDAIWAFINGIRNIAGADKEMENKIQSCISHLEIAIKSDYLKTVPSLIFQTTEGINQALQQRKERFEEHMQEIGQTLRNLRTDLLETRRKLEVDPLTQIYNRGAFDNTLQRYIDLSSFAGQSLVLVMFDLDHFKMINDTYGHPVGDRVLKATASTILRAFPRKSDFVARYGGEEFAVLLLDADAQAAARLVERLLENIRRIKTTVAEGSSEEISITCSAGIAEYCPGETDEQFIKRADHALYRAKNEGRDRFIFNE
jgi:diguanylate cyclase (GGDEF)-like protein